ncbi:hypothetical protein LOK49_LG11G02162 [Camellia lanceoleosa]|uniref:Uncharacterized protein n=1 Tax=Camellia lanceoleosa TaxID=1840588 RepID=A0ACC0FYB6_9ERIC|nr:hypothetical protein LOK49_LG11G02162 [Camellia lanceoleosa]
MLQVRDLLSTVSTHFYSNPYPKGFSSTIIVQACMLKRIYLVYTRQFSVGLNGINALMHGMAVFLRGMKDVTEDLYYLFTVNTRGYSECK